MVVIVYWELIAFFLAVVQEELLRFFVGWSFAHLLDPAPSPTPEAPQPAEGSSLHSGETPALCGSLVIMIQTRPVLFPWSFSRRRYNYSVKIHWIEARRSLYVTVHSSLL